ncbi:ribose ABC transporter substrate-binding protein RbsB [Hydrogenibacillus sp. N12]|uniref:ribose ABC transporter substrate-binding protein RbsB n=1 Tax=Hydrogenibacillus sp. N12 TaxID=2866627 RepID=UPI001C7DC220|nr:ribose ABC transporter substrate-binding protein RbsB [Hydrogenibacillus sp. N12]QZA33256.1 ribose ABC transporter substrate-binding protein RbsB [Hydrogenibacillus sp. N12]
MRTQRRIGVLLVVSLMFLAVLSACGSPAKEAPPSGDAGPSSAAGGSTPAAEAKAKIGFSISTLNNPFFVSLKEGAEKAAQAAGVELVVVDAKDDPAKQVSDLEDLIQQKVDLIILNPTDGDAVVTAVQSANAAGIPVITVDRTANGGDVVAHVASDNFKGGALAAEFIKQALNGQGKVVELQGIPGTSAARDRGEGFHDALAAAPGIEIVASQPADFDRAKGLQVMENILQSHPNIDAVFAHNDEMALGALEALEAAGKKVIVVGFDATEDARKAVEAGRLAATIAQRPEEMGKIAVETAVKVLHGETVDKNIPVPLDLVTKS